MIFWVKYPGLFASVAIAFLLMILSFELLNGHITKSDFNANAWFRFIFLLAVQEWVFQVHLLNSANFYDIFRIWIYGIIQVVLGIVLPTLLYLHYKERLFNDSMINTATDPMSQMEIALFYPHVFIVFNALCFGCFLAPTHFTEKILVTDESIEREFFLNYVEVIVVKENLLIISADDEWYSTKMTEDLKSALKNINPKEFRILDKRIFINNILLQGLKDNSISALITQLDKTFFKLKGDYWVNFIRDEIDKINIKTNIV